MSNNLVDQINQLLPQTQCTRCSYPSCKDYAVAIANGEAQINQCPPGGDAGIAKLAALLNKPILQLNPKYGEIIPKQVVVIEEEVCIGCTLCIKSCPVDAIIGSNKMMHSIIADECTGCELCIPVCPVDCIILAPDENPVWTDARKDVARARFEQHNLRKINEQKEREARLQQQSVLLNKVRQGATQVETKADKKNDILTKILAKAKDL